MGGLRGKADHRGHGGRERTQRGFGLGGFRCYGLEVDDVGFGGVLSSGVAGLFFFAVLFPLFEEDLFEGFVAGGALEFGDGGEGAVEVVVDEFVDGLGGAGGRGLGVGFGEAGEGDLEAVEEEAGAPGVDVVGGDAGEDFAEGELDGGAVFEAGEGEGGLVAAAFLQMAAGDGAAGGVVVVAEVFGFEGG